jgi:hypothetical protein
MVWYSASVILFWLLCIVLSAASLKNHPWTDRPAFLVFSLIGLALGSGGLVAGASSASSGMPAYGPVFLLGGFVPGVILLAPWIVRIAKICIDEAQKFLLDHDKIVFRRSYDLAGKAMHERRYEDAEREYLAGAAEEKDDPEPLRQAGEAVLATGDVERAITHFRSALSRITSDEDRASLAVRIAEIEERRLGDRARARRTLEQVLPGLYPGKWGDLVRERIDRLA